MLTGSMPSPAVRRSVLSILGAALFAALALLPALGHRSLAEWDEAIYAGVSREMLQTGWLVPHWNHEIWLEKPPLMLWITAAFFRLFAVNEFWARAGSALSGIAIVVLLHGWLAKRKDLLAAWLSTLILLGTFGFLHICHVGEMDVLLSLACCISLVGLVQVGEHKRRGWIVFWVGFALALMTKGAASLVLPITVGALALLQRWRLNQFGRPFLLGLLLFLLLTLPWHVAMLHLYRIEFLHQYLGLSVFARSTQQIEGHHTRWWFYLKVLLVSAPPFMLFYPSALAYGLRRRDLQPWTVFALIVLVVFTFAQTRLPHYIAPAYPALSLGTAVFLADVLRSLTLRFPLRSTRTLAASVALVLTGILLWATSPARKALHSEQTRPGPISLDNKESLPLLRDARLNSTPGPLLLLRNGRLISIATDVFYSGRAVQQVQLWPVPAQIPTDRYVFQAMPLEQAVQTEPRLLLLDRALLPQLSSDLTFTPLESSPTQIIGKISRTRPPCLQLGQCLPR